MNNNFYMEKFALIAKYKIRSTANNMIGIPGEYEEDFFETVKAATMGGLYGNPRVAAFFGWEGSSVEHGGYINRGFDDIGWLPNKGGR